MALLFIDGFDHYATTQIGRKWTSTSATTPDIDTTGGRRGTGCLSAAVTARWVQYSFSATATLIAGCAFNRSSGSSAGYIIYFGDGASDQCGVYLETDGRLSFRRGTTAVATSTYTVPATGWVYLEVKVTISNSGSYEIRANGTDILSGSADTQATANATADSVTLHARVASGSTGPNTTTLYDDFYLCDASGGINDDFLGDVRIDAYVPNGAGNSTQLTPSAGANYQCVDDATPDDDSTYVESATASQKDTYAFPSLGYTAVDVFGVQVNATARKDDAGARSLATVTRSGGTDYDGSTQALSTSYYDYREVMNVDPNTSAAWSQSGYEAAEFGVKVAA
jgi:hypothetical protein